MVVASSGGVSCSGSRAPESPVQQATYVRHQTSGLASTLNVFGNGTVTAVMSSCVVATYTVDFSGYSGFSLPGYTPSSSCWLRGSFVMTTPGASKAGLSRRAGSAGYSPQDTSTQPLACFSYSHWAKNGFSVFKRL